MKNLRIFKMNAFLKRFLIVSVLINGVLCMNSCKVEEFDENSLSISVRLSQDSDFRSSLEQWSTMQAKLAKKLKEMNSEDKKIFLKSIVQKSQSTNSNDLVILSQMIGYSNVTEMNNVMQNYTNTLSNLSKKFPELRQSNNISKMLEDGVYEMTKQENIENARMNSFVGPYSTDDYDLVDPQNGRCKKGYKACLIKSWGVGQGAVFACAGLVVPWVAAGCAIAVTIGTLAAYSECYDIYCEPGVENFYAPAPINPRPPFYFPGIPTNPWAYDDGN